MQFVYQNRGYTHISSDCSGTYGGAVANRNLFVRTQADSRYWGMTANNSRLGQVVYTSPDGRLGTIDQDFRAPSKPGIGFGTSGEYYGGGLIRIAAGSIELDGKITACGDTHSSGGGIHLELDGGAVTGSGVVDVGGKRLSAADNPGNGGRISITGYSSLSAELIANARLDGNRQGVPGTLFHRASCEPKGHLLVNA